MEPKDSLPADKMRVLVDLYHESASYITKENLSAAIDNAFIYRPNQRMAGSSAPEQTFPQLQVELAKRRAMPRFAQPGQGRARVRVWGAEAVRRGPGEEGPSPLGDTPWRGWGRGRECFRA